jgi:hypothetical protein
MTTEASLPSDDEIEEPEAPIAKVLKAAALAEAMAQPQEPVVEESVAEPWEAEAVAQPQEPVVEEIVAEPSEAEAPGEGLTDAMAAWTEALRSVERSINDAAEAIRFLRATIQQMAPLWRSLGGLEEAMRGFEEQPRRRPEPQAIVDSHAAPLQYDEEEGGPEPSRPPGSHHDEVVQSEREWPVQRRKALPKERSPKWGEVEGQWTPPAGPPRPSLKPVTLVPDDTPAPYAYRVTIEDRKSPVELVELHRALTSIPSVRNLSLLNYVNGIASLSLETTDEIQPAELENAVKKIMKRSCSVVPHESNVILIQVGE